MEFENATVGRLDEGQLPFTFPPKSHYFTQLSSLFTPKQYFDFVNMPNTDPITRASQSSTLPRQARARINMTTDPVPEGKVLEAQPTHHMMTPIDSATRGAMEGTSLQQSIDEGEEQQGGAAAVVRDAHNREVQKMHHTLKHTELGGGGHGHKNLKPQQAGMDWLGASTAANKKMDSRQTHSGGNLGGGGGGNHNKHLDTVYRSAGKGNQKKG
jgi:hypothetical protein